MKRVWTVPNVLSMLRIALVPLYIFTYFNSGLSNHLWWAFGVVVLSGLTDVADGIIARKCNLITDLGKILDPIADKLTQAAVLVSMSIRHTEILALTVLLFVKDLMILLGFLLIRKKQTNYAPAARWWGKAATVSVFLTMVCVLFSDLISGFPSVCTYISTFLSICLLSFSFGAYFLQFVHVRATKMQEE